MTKLADLVKGARALPDINFNWAGPEQWHDDVFRNEVPDFESAKEYIDELRRRMGEYAITLHDLIQAYRQMRDIMLEAELR